MVRGASPDSKSRPRPGFEQGRAVGGAVANGLVRDLSGSGVCYTAGRLFGSRVQLFLFDEDCSNGARERIQQRRTSRIAYLLRRQERNRDSIRNLRYCTWMRERFVEKTRDRDYGVGISGVQSAPSKPSQGRDMKVDRIRVLKQLGGDLRKASGCQSPESGAIEFLEKNSSSVRERLVQRHAV